MSISNTFIENILKRFFILLLGSWGGTWDAGGSKTLARGFAMVPHRLHIVVFLLLYFFDKHICCGVQLKLLQ